MKNLILKILLALKMAPKDKDLQEMRLYKTNLSPEEYTMMVHTIMETEVKPYGKKDKGTFH